MLHQRVSDAVEVQFPLELGLLRLSLQFEQEGYTFISNLQQAKSKVFVCRRKMVGVEYLNFLSKIFSHNLYGTRVSIHQPFLYQ